jgi:hypothetical protein
MPERVLQRFEHYQLVTGEDGRPVELGRGAMGVTYKAFDVDLHCPGLARRRNPRYAPGSRGCRPETRPRHA